MAINVGTAEGYLDLNTTGFKASLLGALGDLESFSSSATSFGSKLTSIGDSISSVGEKLTKGLTLPLGGLGVATLKLGMDFDSEMSKVQATLGASTGEMAQLHDEAIKLGADTAFSAKEAAEGMENLASAGFSANEIMAAAPGMLDLAAAGDLSVADASDIASSSLRGFGLAASDSGHVADVFAKAAADTNANVTDMGEAMKYAAPVAHAFGWSIEETSSAIGTMANAGIKGSQAGTTLRSALTSLAKPSKEAADLMGQMGFNAFDAQGKMLPLSQVMDNLQKSTANMTQQQKEAALSTIFGTEALSGMQVMLNAGPDALQQETDALKNCNGAARQMGQTMQDNLKGDVQALGGSFETAAISLEEIMTPALRDIIKALTETVNGFNNLNNSQKTMVLTAAGMAGSLGPVLQVFGGMTSGIGKMYKSIGDGSRAVKDFGLGAVEHFGNAGKSVTDFVGKSTLLRSLTNDLTMFFRSPLSSIGLIFERMEGLFPLLTRVRGFFAPIANEVTLMFSGAMLKVIAFGEGIGGHIIGLYSKLPAGLRVFLETSILNVRGFFSKITALLPAFAAFGSKLTGGLGKLIMASLKIVAPASMIALALVGLGEIQNHFGNQIGQLVQTVVQKGPQMIQQFTAKILTQIPLLMQSGTTLIVEIVQAINANLPQILHSAVMIIAALVNGLAQNLPVLIPQALSLIQTIATAIITNLPLIIQAGLNLILALAQSFANNTQQVVSVIVQLVITLATTIINNLPQFIEAAIKIIVALVQGLSQAIPQLIAAMPQVIEAIWNALKNVNWGDLGSQIIAGIGAGIKAAAGGLLGILKSVAGDAVKGVKAFLGIKSPSRVFRDEVGQWIPAGIGVGVKENAGLVQKELNNIAKDLYFKPTLTPAFNTVPSLQKPQLNSNNAENQPSVPNQFQFANGFNLNIYGDMHFNGYDGVKKLSRDMYNSYINVVKAKGGTT